MVQLEALGEARIPGFPTAPLTIDGIDKPLQIVADEDVTENSDTNNITAAIGVATVLHRWCPEALYAFLDLDAWFSFTWNLAIQDELTIEIGRVRDRVTIGILDKSGGDWTLMLTYEIETSDPGRGTWTPDTNESMQNDKDIKDPSEINKLGQQFVKDLLVSKRWLTGPKLKHRLFVEYAPMDIWGDGIQMNPHWLYKALDLSSCSHCEKRQSSAPLNRCSRCGTAAYCSGACQKADWAVHKAICNMDLEERGKALHISKDRGFVAWDKEKTAGAGEDGTSMNPNFKTGAGKRMFGC
jgi:hypothetical protein